MKKVVVAGFGFIGKIHAFNILKNPDTELVAIVDKNIETIEKELNSKSGNLNAGELNSEDIKGIKKYSDLDECIENEKPDAIHICVHTDLHYLFVKKVLNKGVNVLVEKPFTLDLAKGEELIRLAKSKGLILMVAHVVRFMPPYQKLKEMIDSKKYGRLNFLSLTRFSGVPEWGEWKDKQKDFGSSGGALFDLVIHDIDIALFLTGKRPSEINSSYLPGKLSRHDYINAIWKFTDDDTMVKIEGGNIFHSAFPFQAGFMAKFEKASVLFSTLNPEVILISDDKGTVKIPAGDTAGGYYNEIEYFYNCIDRQEEPEMCTPESSLQAIKVCYEHI